MEPFSIEEYKQTFLSDDRLSSIYEKKWFKLFVPSAYDGLELPLHQGLEVLIEAATMQGGLGWTINLGAGANWFSGFFNDHAAREIFVPQDAVIAGSGFASGSWQQGEGENYIINGIWSRCTGAKHATFFSLNARNADNKEEVKTFVVPRNCIQLADEKWQIFGLRNTSSYAIDIEKQAVPERYSFEINTLKNPNAYLVHQVPFETFARLCMSASFIGIVKCFMDKAKRHPLNKVALEMIEKKIEPVLKNSEDACLKWSSHVEQLVENNQLSHQVCQDLKSSLGNNNVELYELVQELFFVSGLPIVEEDTLVHWAYRDVMTAVQHYMVKP